MAMGFHLSLEAPSLTAVALCLTHAVMDKTAWLAARGIEAEWPARGIPRVIHVDNGAEFHALAFERACAEHGVDLIYRPPGTPRFGGHIERLIGTMMGAVHLLPGSHFSSIRERGDLDPGVACGDDVARAGDLFRPRNRRRLSRADPSGPRRAAECGMAGAYRRGRGADADGSAPVPDRFPSRPNGACCSATGCISSTSDTGRTNSGG